MSIAKLLRMLTLKRRLQTVLVVFLSSLPISNYATDNSQWFPAIGPRLAPTGMTGDYLTGEGDLLLPTYGSDTGFLFTNFDGKYGNSGDTSYLSAALGYRGIFADRIAGAYVFGDYNYSPYNNKFWVINPGIESLGRVVDFRANGYIAIEFEQDIGGPAFAEAMGNYTYTTFQGHSQYDALLQSYESIGYGGDAEIGSILPYLSSIRAYVGGYYFDQK